MKTAILFCFLSAAIFFPADISFAREIQGKVMDKHNEPLFAVSVIVKHAGYGTTTDFDGNFALTVADSAVVLHFTYIGYIDKEIVVPKNTNTLTVILEESAVKLESVVVTCSKYEKRSSESACSMEVLSVSSKGIKSHSKKSSREYAPSMEGDGKSFSSSGATAGILTAGEIHDFSKWALWEDITKDELNFYTTVWKTHPIERYTLQLTTEQGMPVVDAEVKLADRDERVLWKARTDNTGKAELWLNAFTNESASEQKTSYSILVLHHGRQYVVESVTKFHDGINVLKIPVQCAMPDKIDIAFVVDATGSMQDEINYLKSELNDIVRKISDSLPDTKLNLGCVFYRDEGDAYVTKKSDFSPHVSVTAGFIKSNNADGGGDMPEAVEQALDVAVNELEWDENARARILFLVLDAPPHGNDAVIKKLHRTIMRAAEKGIRIIPVACSGIDKSTEYLMRALSLLTNGSYVFLTDHSGVGNPHIKPTTDKYDVNLLNTLLQNLILKFTTVPPCGEPALTENADTAFIEIPDTAAQATDSPGETPPDAPTSRKKNKPENEESAVKWKYYPNPTFGKVTVEAPRDFKTLFVTDFSGKILQRHLAGDHTTFEIDLSDFATGTYFLKCEYAADKWATGRVVVTH